MQWTFWKLISNDLDIIFNLRIVEIAEQKFIKIYPNFKYVKAPSYYAQNTANFSAELVEYDEFYIQILYGAPFQIKVKETDSVLDLKVRLTN